MNAHKPGMQMPGLRLIVLLAATTALAGCLGSSGGGGGDGGAGDFAAFASNYDRVSALVPTTDMPVSGSASYSGMTSLTLREGADEIGEVLGDIALDVTFAPGMDGTVSGSADNFRGTVDGAEQTFAGSLTTAASEFASTILIEDITVGVPGVGEVSSRVGALTVNMAGEVDVDGETGTVQLGLGGNFAGAGAQAAFGGATLTVVGPGGLQDTTGSGFFYVER